MESYFCPLGSHPDLDPSTCPISADVLPCIKNVLPAPHERRAGQRKIYLDVLSSKKGVLVRCYGSNFSILTTSFLSVEAVQEACQKCAVSAPDCSEF